MPQKQFCTELLRVLSFHNCYSLKSPEPFLLLSSFIASALGEAGVPDSFRGKVAGQSSRQYCSSCGYCCVLFSQAHGTVSFAKTLQVGAFIFLIVTSTCKGRKITGLSLPISENKLFVICFWVLSLIILLGECGKLYITETKQNYFVRIGLTEMFSNFFWAQNYN